MTDNKIYQLLKRVKSFLTFNDLDAELEIEINILVSQRDEAVRQSEKLLVLLSKSNDRFYQLEALRANRSFFQRLFNI